MKFWLKGHLSLSDTWGSCSGIHKKNILSVSKWIRTTIAYMPKKLISRTEQKTTWERALCSFWMETECLRIPFQFPRAAMVVQVAVPSGRRMGSLMTRKNGSRLAGLSNHREQITKISFEPINTECRVCKPTLGNLFHFFMFFWGYFWWVLPSQISCPAVLSKTLFVLLEGETAHGGVTRKLPVTRWGIPVQECKC